MMTEENGLKLMRTVRAWYPLTPRPVDKYFVLNLTGDNGFMSMNEYSYQMPPSVPEFVPNPNPMKVAYGDRVCILIRSFSPWAHPMHLHGHIFQLVEVNGVQVDGAMSDTVMSTKGCGTVTVCFDAGKRGKGACRTSLTPAADNPGMWPFHCHKDFHMMAGMITTVEYDAMPGTVPNSALFTPPTAQQGAQQTPAPSPIAATPSPSGILPTGGSDVTATIAVAGTIIVLAGLTIFGVRTLRPARWKLTRCS